MWGFEKLEWGTFCDFSTVWVSECEVQPETGCFVYKLFQDGEKSYFIIFEEGASLEKTFHKILSFVKDSRSFL